MKKTILKYTLPILIGIACLFVPLIQHLHIESALAAALAGCFWAGWVAAGPKRTTQTDLRQCLKITGCVYLFGLPLLVNALVTGCFSFNGLGFWLLYPLPAIFFGYALGRLLRIWRVPYGRLITIILLLGIAVGVLLYEFFNYPQLYFYNQVWGGWPGPIYDETVKVHWSLIWFRILTLLWIGLFWWIPSFLQSIKAEIVVILCAILLIAGYNYLPQLGIISPRSYLQKELRGMKNTSHFIIHYDKNNYSTDEIGFIAQKQEFYYHQITQKLHISLPDSAPKIESYLYGNAWQKKRLVGAKFTSYVPVWLNQDQLHIAKQEISGSLKHELVHVLAKQFGNRWIHASWSVGLVEGLAVAIAKQRSPVATIDQIVRSEKPYPTAKEMRHALSFWGFYSGRSAVNYIQTGSFVHYLLHHYPVKKFKQAYRTGNIAKAYKPSFKTLVTGWHHALDMVKIDSTDQKVAATIYSFPSLFQQKCPHIQTPFAHQWDRYRYFMAIDDTTKAIRHLNEALKIIPAKQAAKSAESRWAYLNLKTGHPQKVAQRANRSDSSITDLMFYADAFAMDGKMQAAKEYVHRAARLLHKHPDSTLQAALHTRKHSTLWDHYRAIIYRSKPVSDSVFNILDVHTQARALRQAINRQNWKQMKHYASVALGDSLNTIYFDTYLKVIQWVAYEGEIPLAKRWVRKIEKQPLRLRYKQRLQESKEWIGFLEEK
jgi:tetratricopeptide (TPR) repeat protein